MKIFECRVCGYSWEAEEALQCPICGSRDFIELTTEEAPAKGTNKKEDREKERFIATEERRKETKVKVGEVSEERKEEKERETFGFIIYSLDGEKPLRVEEGDMWNSLPEAVVIKNPLNGEPALVNPRQVIKKGEILIKKVEDEKIVLEINKKGSVIEKNGIEVHDETILRKGDKLRINKLITFIWR